MLVLAIETAAGAVSAAVLDGSRDPRGQPLASAALEDGRGSGDRLIGLVRALLHEAGRTFAELHVIAVNRGPGSFTGVRTGVAAARALALATDRPVIGVTTFETLAVGVGAHRCGCILAAIDARRGQLYTQVFDVERRPLTVPAAVAPECALADLPEPVLVVGTGAQLLVGSAAGSPDAQVVVAGVDAGAVGRVAVMKMRAGLAPEPGFRLEPLYLRPPDARPRTSMLKSETATGP